MGFYERNDDGKDFFMSCHLEAFSFFFFLFCFDDDLVSSGLLWSALSRCFIKGNEPNHECEMTRDILGRP